MKGSDPCRDHLPAPQRDSDRMQLGRSADGAVAPDRGAEGSDTRSRSVVRRKQLHRAAALASVRDQRTGGGPCRPAPHGSGELPRRRHERVHAHRPRRATWGQKTRRVPGQRPEHGHGGAPTTRSHGFGARCEPGPQLPEPDAVCVNCVDPRPRLGRRHRVPAAPRRQLMLPRSTTHSVGWPVTSVIRSKSAS